MKACGTVASWPKPWHRGRDLEKLAHASMQGHVDRLQKGLCTPERGLVFVEVVGAVENIVRHLENIAQRSDQLTEAAT